MKKKAIIAGATGVLCGFLYTAVKKNKAKNIEEEKENTDNVIVVGAPGSGKTQDVIKHALLQNTGSIIVNDEDLLCISKQKIFYKKEGIRLKNWIFANHRIPAHTIHLCTQKRNEMY